MKVYGYLYQCEAKLNKEMDGTEATICWRERKIRPLTFAIELYTNLRRDRDSQYFCPCQYDLKPKDRKRKNNCKVLKYEISIRRKK